MNQVCSKGQKRKIMSTKVKNPRELSVGIHEKQVKSEHAERLHHFNKKLCDLDIKVEAAHNTNIKLQDLPCKT